MKYKRGRPQVRGQGAGPQSGQAQAGPQRGHVQSGHGLRARTQDRCGQGAGPQSGQGAGPQYTEQEQAQAQDRRQA